MSADDAGNCNKQKGNFEPGKKLFQYQENKTQAED
jgi:hypothetical protein